MVSFALRSHCVPYNADSHRLLEAVLHDVLDNSAVAAV